MQYDAGMSNPWSDAPTAGHGVIARGSILDGRFVVDTFVRAGGMGSIHRGRDLRSGRRVAIKVMTTEWMPSAARFEQEALMLAALSHDAIVEYVAHGTADGAPFLVMEWLDGEDLAARLARGRLNVADTLTLLRRACEGLAAAHERGVVHRDLKPSNLFLVAADVARAKLLDFGIARPVDVAVPLTQSGMILGTVGYMSPEQAMGPHEVDSRADVFSLGCVLFECLTGRAAFAGPNPVAVLARVLQDVPPPVSETRPDVDASIDSLVACMLSKNPADRPRDARDVLAALDALPTTSDRAEPKCSAALTTFEQRLVSVVIGRPRNERLHEDTATSPPHDDELTAVRLLSQRFGAEPIPMRGGGVLSVLSGRGAATDQASQAARFAIMLTRLRPDLRVVVATGRVETATGRVPVGVAIDRASRLLETGNVTSGVVVDELTQGLLDTTFEVESNNGQRCLIGERSDIEAERLLMGKATPFLGRERELGLLELTLRECIDESVPQTVLVTAPPGQGKSRLRQEFVLKARKERDLAVFVARADPVAAGSAFLLVRQIVRQAVGAHDGDTDATQHMAIRSHMQSLVAGVEAERTADFLGELIGLPCADRPSPELRAARNDQQIMSVWLRRSFVEWLAIESAARPLLIVLEDLHWGDVPSMTFIEDALRVSSERRIFVLVVARPEVNELFGGLRNLPRRQEIVLGPLSARAAERIVRETLGPVSSDVVSRILKRADGNPFYLEELIRSAANGSVDEEPDTVLAVVQSRLERLPPEARRVVRAASVFGETFSADGVRALLGPDGNARDTARELTSLVANDVLVPSHNSRFSADREYAFRHSLLREAAYAMLTEADRVTGHRLAGEFLEGVGERAALVLAQHFEIGGSGTRAAGWLRQAAQTAFDGGNLADVSALVQRALACGPTGFELGRLRVLDGQVASWRSDWAASVAAGREALGLLAAGSLEWFVAVAGLLYAGSFLGDTKATGEALVAVLSVPIQPEASGPFGFAMACAIQGLAQLGQKQAAYGVLERTEVMQRGESDDDPVFVLWLRLSRGHLNLLDGKLGDSLESISSALTMAVRHESAIGRAFASGLLAQTLFEISDIEAIERAAREILPFAGQAGFNSVIDWTTHFLSITRTAVGRPLEAIEPLRALLDREDHRLVTGARSALAASLAEAGALEEAAEQARIAVEHALFPTGRAGALASQATVQLRLGAPEKALESAELGIAATVDVANPFSLRTLYLARAEAKFALGDLTGARGAIREARDYTLRLADSLHDSQKRKNFLDQVKLNVRILALAHEWLDAVTGT